MTKLGTYGATVSSQDILSLVTYLRWKECKRVLSVQIRPQAAREDNPSKLRAQKARTKGADRWRLEIVFLDHQFKNRA